MKAAWLLCAVLTALGFLPLLGGFRYEAALAAGLIGPGFAACVAFQTGRARSRAWSEGGRREAFGLGWVLEVGGWHAGAVLLAASVHELLRGSCELLQGIVLYVLGPVAGTLLGAAFGGGLGALAALVLPLRWTNRGALVLLAPLGPLGSALFGLGEFYFGPAIYAYDPFAGYFAGPLYDTIPFELERLAVFRAGSALSLCAFFCLARALRVRSGARGLRALSLVGSKPLTLGVVLASASLAHAFFAPELGLATSARSLERALRGRAQRGVCHVHYSPWVSPKVAQRVALECVGHVRAHRRYFELSGAGPAITVHLFASAEEKGRLMGARTTYLAKPWRREVFVQADVFPHPVLGHELAHAVTAEFGQGPFRVAGPLGGLLPDPGRIEGFAVAASPTEEGDATEAEWARAMLDAGQLPPSSRLFSLGFLGAAAVKSYTSAGAFVGYLHQTYGPSVMKRWYGGEALDQLSGRSLAELDRDYRAALGRERVSPRVRALAEELFSRPSLFGRSCPHAADRALEEAHALCPVNAEEAERAFRRALALDRTRRDAEGLLPACYLSAGRPERAGAILRGLQASPEVSGREKIRALVTSADLAWLNHRNDEAKTGYEEALRGALTTPEARSVSLKRWALDQPEPVHSAVRRWLAAGDPAGSDPAARLAPLFEWHASGPERGVAAYLLGLQLLEADLPRGRALLDEALESGELQPSFVVEAQRRLLIAACLAGDAAGIDAAAAALAHQQESSVQARRAPRLRERCVVGALR